MNQAQFDEIMAWKDKIFPNQTILSQLIHLAGEEPGGEIGELIADLKSDSPGKKLEFADCFILLFGSAYKAGMTLTDIQNAIDEKMAINHTRDWGIADENGVVNHIEPKNTCKK